MALTSAAAASKLTAAIATTNKLARAERSSQRSNASDTAQSVVTSNTERMLNRILVLFALCLLPTADFRCSLPLFKLLQRM
jgi:hypothetical protein